jgi:hypothetical protein
MLPPALLYAAGVPVLLAGDFSGNQALFGLGGIVHILAVSGLVLAVALSVFRYRLYDLQIVIRRTVTYGLLTAALGLVYYASVVLLQQIFPSGSQLTTVASTLAMAALFTPFRRRIQEVIDRRFFRPKYDAAKILARFGGEMRDQVDLDRLARSLGHAVTEALQPNHISLWLRKPDN